MVKPLVNVLPKFIDIFTSDFPSRPFHIQQKLTKFSAIFQTQFLNLAKLSKIAKETTTIQTPVILSRVS